MEDTSIHRNGCPNDNHQKIYPNYEPGFVLPYPFVSTTKKPLHISIPSIVDKAKKDLYPKKYKQEEDEKDEDDDDYEDYEEDDKETEGYDPDDYMKYNCELCLKRKIRRRSDDIDEKESLKTGKESKTDVELARDGFYKKYKKGSNTNGYSSKLHKDELFKDHIYYDA